MTLNFSKYIEVTSGFINSKKALVSSRLRLFQPIAKKSIFEISPKIKRLLYFSILTGYIGISLLFKAVHDPAFFGILVLKVFSVSAFFFAYFTFATRWEQSDAGSRAPALKFRRCPLRASPAIHDHSQSQSTTAVLAKVLIMYKEGNAPSAPTCVMRITTVSSIGSLFHSVLQIPRQP